MFTREAREPMTTHRILLCSALAAATLALAGCERASAASGGTANAIPGGERAEPIPVEAAPVLLRGA